MNYNRLDQGHISPDPLQGQTTLPEQDALIRPDPASRQDTVPLRDPLPGRFDLSFTLLPFLCFFALAGAMFFFPEKTRSIIAQARFFFGDTLGSFYLILGFGIFLLSLYLMVSDYGKIVLGPPGEKPKHSFFTWGATMFTCGLAADILFYSFAEWVLYASDPSISASGHAEEWASVYPLFHWSFIPWAFYLVLAVSFGFMLHVRQRSKQRFSEACRPILKEKADGVLGRIIDLFALFALLAGTATTFSVATPLMSEIILTLLPLPVSRKFLTVLILLLTCTVYTYAALQGFRGIHLLAKICIQLFFLLLAAVFLFGGEAKFIVENGLQSLGAMMQNFISLSTTTDPLRQTHFPQNWTIYYWAYWMVWCVAAPFFIGSISRGRTVRQVIGGGYLFGVGSTLVSFLVLGGYGQALEYKKIADFLTPYQNGADLYRMILKMMETLPLSSLFLLITLLCMICFYATSFDSIAYTAACYSYRRLEEGAKPRKRVIFLWCLLLIVLPIALVFSDSSMQQIQSVSIIFAFPIGIILLLVIYSFLKDARLVISSHI